MVFILRRGIIIVRSCDGNGATLWRIVTQWRWSFDMDNENIINKPSIYADCRMENDNGEY